MSSQAATTLPGRAPSESATACKPPARAAALARAARLVAGWATLGLLAGLVAVVAGGVATGYSALTVISGSMTPTLGVGDIVVDRAISPGQAKVGDVITFKDVQRAQLVTHRVRRIRVTADQVRFVTQGDANNTVERWSIQQSGTIGRVEFRVPKLGRTLAWVRGTPGFALFLIIPGLGLAALELVRIWRKPRRRSP